jgi:hypothetical protein
MKNGNGILVNVSAQSALGLASDIGSWADVADTSWYSPRKNEFMLQNAAELAGLAKIVNNAAALYDDFAGKTIRLASDIDLAGRVWAPIGGTFSTVFGGTFDGDGCAISGMTINSDSTARHLGLFGYIDGGIIKNVRLAGFGIAVSASCGLFAGGLVGINGGRIENCAVSGAVFVSAHSSSVTGGLVGYNTGAIANNCSADGIVASCSSSDFSYAGGLVGGNDGTITNGCAADCSVSAVAASSSCAGGFVGHNTGTIESCTASGKNVSAAGESGKIYGGGFIGWNWDTAALRGNRNETGLSPAIMLDIRKTPPCPSDDI